MGPVDLPCEVCVGGVQDFAEHCNVDSGRDANERGGVIREGKAPFPVSQNLGRDADPFGKLFYGKPRFGPESLHPVATPGTGVRVEAGYHFRRRMSGRARRAKSGEKPTEQPPPPEDGTVADVGAAVVRTAVYRIDTLSFVSACLPVAVMDIVSFPVIVNS